MSITLAAPASRPEEKLVPPPRVAGALYVVAMFMTIMDQTILNVALPAIGSTFGVSASAGAAVVVGYLVSLAVVIPSAGWIGDRIGARRALLLALAVFTAASAACGFAATYGQLVAFRVVQGAGGGLAIPVATALLYRALAPERRARASAALSAPVWVAPALGPVLGGLLVEQLSWRWTFLINVPIGVAAIVAGAVFLRDDAARATVPFDGLGFLLAGVGFAGVLFAVSVAPERGWGDPAIVAAGVGGVAAVAALVRRQLLREHPLIDVRLLADRLFRATNVTHAFGYGAFIAVVFLVPLYVQVGLGHTALESGLTTLPEAVAGVLFSPVVSRLYPVVGPRRLAAGGLAGTAIAAALFVLTGASSSLWQIRGLMVFTGATFTATYIAIQVSSFATITDRQTGHASSLFSVQRQLSAALGVAVAGAVLGATAPLAATTTARAATVPGFHRAFLVAAGLSLVAALMALRIRDDDAAGTMTRRARPAAPAGVGG
ncbi:MAG: hypothetical protein QOH72_5695 [Solirubrobacteraceae bacterium]|jgi:EmrB/QacA subfamily drug resistance transporter|nr:hypothetical protein [Solirubrobacteraceae bacterium]